MRSPHRFIRGVELRTHVIARLFLISWSLIQDVPHKYEKLYILILYIDFWLTILNYFSYDPDTAI